MLAEGIYEGSALEPLSTSGEDAHPDRADACARLSLNNSTRIQGCRKGRPLVAPRFEARGRKVFDLKRVAFVTRTAHHLFIYLEPIS